MVLHCSPPFKRMRRKEKRKGSKEREKEKKRNDVFEKQSYREENACGKGREGGRGRRREVYFFSWSIPPVATTIGARTFSKSKWVQTSMQLCFLRHINRKLYPKWRIQDSNLTCCRRLNLLHHSAGPQIATQIALLNDCGRAMAKAILMLFLPTACKRLNFFAVFFFSLFFIALQFLFQGGSFQVPLLTSANELIMNSAMVLSLY